MIGFDGIWRHSGEADLIVEVKPTDYFSLNLEKLNRVIGAKNVSEHDVMLPVVVMLDSRVREYEHQRPRLRPLPAPHRPQVSLDRKPSDR